MTRIIAPDETPMHGWLTLKKALEMKAPAWLSELAPPVTTDEIKLAEDILGFTLPIDVVEFYCVHNGELLTKNSSSEILSEGYILPLVGDSDSLVGEWQNMHSSDMGSYQGDNKKWLPFASDFSGNLVCFDENCQIILFDHQEEAAKVLAPNIGAFLSQRAQQLLNSEVITLPVIETLVTVKGIGRLELGAEIDLPELQKFKARLLVIDPKVVWQRRRESSFYKPHIDDALGNRQKTFAFSVLVGNVRAQAYGTIHDESELKIEANMETLRLVNKSGTVISCGCGTEYHSLPLLGEIPIWYVEARPEITTDTTLEVVFEHRNI